MTKKNTENTLIKKYVRLLREASGHGGGMSLRLPELPEVVLPAPKIEMIDEILKESEKPDGIYERTELEALAESLEIFTSKSELKTDFRTHIVTAPFMISLVYTIWIVFHRAYWMWILLPPILFVATSGSIGILTTFKKRNFWLSLLLEFLRLSVLISYAGLWIRLVIYSGLYGIYNSTFKGFNLGHLLRSLFAIFIGYFFSKSLNTLHYFVFNNEYKGFPEKSD